MASRLIEAGLSVYEAPALSIHVLPTPRPLPEPGNLYLFVSRQAVDAYFSVARADWPCEAWAAAVGGATRDALRAHVPDAQILAPSMHAASDSEALLSVIQAQELAPAQAHILRAQRGRDWMAEQLRLRGWHVTCHALYERTAVVMDFSACRVLAQDPQCILLVTSLEALDAIDASLRHHGLRWPDALRAVTLHARMERQLQCQYADKPAGALQVKLSAADDVSLFHAILNASRLSH
ncbi:MAG TPA: uroporphyrinogen-III synthase [Castellaniella sp.]